MQAELGVRPPEQETSSSPALQIPSAPESEIETEEMESVSTEEQNIEIPKLTKTLFLGSKGEDVRNLQEYLAKDKKIYPEGLITGYFGPLTKLAVKRWQKKHGIEPAGIVGPKTMTKFEELGKTVVQRLIEQGVGVSEVVPPGLLIAPGIQKKLDIATIIPLATSTTTAPAATTTLPVFAAPSVAATTTAATTTISIIATTTPSGATTAAPAVPVATVSGGGDQTISATPAITQTSTVLLSATTTTATSTDTASPIISNVSAGNLSAYSATINWTTNETATSYIQWGLTPSYSFSDSSMNTLVISHSVAISALQSNTLYHYKVISNDAAGNSAVSNDYTFTTSLATATPASNLLAPAMSYFKWGSNVNPCRLNSNAVFKYQRAANNYLFNVYLQKPNQSAFTKYTYIIPTSDYVAVAGAENTSLNGSILDASGQTSWQWTTGTQSADTFTNGVYRMYVTVTGTDGKEGPSSAVLTNTLNAPPTITNPTDNSTVGNLPVTISLSNAVSGLYYNYFIYYGASQLWESRYVSQTTIQTTISSFVASTYFTNGKIFQIYVDGFDNPYGAFSTTKQKCAISSFNFGAVTADTTPPSVPANLTATSISSSQISLSWTASTDNVGVTGYKIYRNSSYLTSVTTTSYSDIGLSAGSSYSHTVSAYDAAGNVSMQSSSVSVTTLSATSASSIPQVQGFTASVSDSSVNLSWQDATGTYSLAGSPNNMFGTYNIYRGSSADFTPSPIPSNPTNLIVQGSVLSYTDSNLSARTYYYKIALQDKNGIVGSASQAVSATIQTPTDTTPPVISSVSASSITSNSATLIWTTNESANSLVEYGLTPMAGARDALRYIDSYTTLIPRDPTLVTSHSVPLLNNLQAGTLYYFNVYSTDAASNTAMSSDNTFTTNSVATSTSLREKTLNQMADILNSLKSTVDELLKILK